MFLLYNLTVGFDGVLVEQGSALSMLLPASPWTSVHSFSKNDSKCCPTTSNCYKINSFYVININLVLTYRKLEYLIENYSFSFIYKHRIIW